MKMGIEKIAPELRKPTKRMAAMPMPIGNRFGRAIMRKLMTLAPAPKTDAVVIETRDNPPVHIFRPKEQRSDGAVFWIHGGGYVIGSPKQDYAHNVALAEQLGIVIASPVYRLVPDHPFPAPLDDCHAAWTWLLGAAPGLGIDPAKIVIAGQSAGGGLAAALVQRLHDEGGVQPLAQMLYCPMIDDRTAADTSLDNIGHYVWDNRLNRIGWRGLLGREPGADDLPPYAAAARRADLSGLPPAWIGVGSVDLFRDEDKTYADRLQAAEVPVRYYETPGAPHGFEGWAAETDLAQAYLADARSWLKKRLQKALRKRAPR